MGAFFAKEIMDGAIRIEQNGLAFYRNLSEREDQEEIRGVFEYLAGEEERHIAEFKRLSGNLQDPPDIVWERDDFSLYMENLSDDHVFKGDGSGEKRAREVKSPLEAVRLGIRFEKDTILFFNELKNLVRREENQVIERLIRWEKDHLVRLFRLKRQLEHAQRQ